MADGLEKIGFTIEKSKKKEDKIKIPVLFGLNGSLEKSFDADGVNLTYKNSYWSWSRSKSYKLSVFEGLVSGLYDARYRSPNNRYM